MSRGNVSLGGRLVFGALGLLTALLRLVLVLVGVVGGGYGAFVVSRSFGLGNGASAVLLVVAVIAGLVVGAKLGSLLRKPISRRKAYYYTWTEEYHGPEEVSPVSFALRGDPDDLPGVDEEELLAEIAGEFGFDGDIDDAIEASDDFGGADAGGFDGGGGGFDGGGGGGGGE